MRAKTCQRPEVSGHDRPLALVIPFSLLSGDTQQSSPSSARQFLSERQAGDQQRRRTVNTGGVRAWKANDHRRDRQARNHRTRVNHRRSNRCQTPGCKCRRYPPSLSRSHPGSRPKPRSSRRRRPTTGGPHNARGVWPNGGAKLYASAVRNSNSSPGRDGTNELLTPSTWP